MKLTASINFINILPANYLYEHCFGSFFSSYMYMEKAAKMTFVQKIIMYNVDEIDYWNQSSKESVVLIL